MNGDGKKIVALVTVGHSPREDIVPELRSMIRPDIAIRQAGALDALSPDAALERYAPVDGGATMVSRLSDGRMGSFSAEKMMPVLQDCIDRVCGEGADIVAILCTNRFTGLHCRVPLILPFDLLHASVQALNAGLRIAALFPLQSHAEQMARWWREYGVDADYLCAAPADPPDSEAIVAQFASADLLILDCIGYCKKTRDLLAKRLQIPVVWPRAMIADMINSLLA